MDSQIYGNEPIPGPPLNIDALLHEISASKMSTGRPQSMSSSSYRSRIGKVTKPGSAGSSPQNMQRRRTSASHRLAKYLSDLYPFSAYGQQMAPDPYSDAQSSEPASSPFTSRPVSWHPSTMLQLDAEQSAPQSRMSMAFPPYQSVQRYGTPTPVAQFEMHPEMLYEDWSSLGVPDYSSPPVNGYVYPVTTTGPLQPGLSTGRPIPMSPMGLPLEDLQQIIPPSARSSGVWPSFQAATSAVTMSGITPTSMPAFTAPSTPDMLPIQQPLEPQVLDMEKTNGLDAMEENDGPELVGMGLYDTPTRPDFTRADKPGGLLLMGMATEPTGKGLKLEETWEPPEEDDEDDFTSDTSEDAPNEEDDDLTDLSPQLIEPSQRQPLVPIETSRYIMTEDGSHCGTLQRMYGDISKQSFFIDGDETNGQIADGSMVLGSEVSQLWLRAMMAGS